VEVGAEKLNGEKDGRAEEGETAAVFESAFPLVT
jgi:hypothetical protein